jgi:hypothetical protein
VNDTWRIRPNLSVDYGLRYEYNSVPRDAHNRIENALRLIDLPKAGASRFDNNDRTLTFSSAVDAYAEVLDGRKQIYEPDANNFGPHVGIAWAPRSGNTAVRGGYGIYYDTILGAVVSQSRNVFSREIPINVDPSFLQFSLFSLNNPAFLQAVMDANGNFTNPVSLLQPGACNRFGTCNQFGGAREDFGALIGCSSYRIHLADWRSHYRRRSFVPLTRSNGILRSSASGPTTTSSRRLTLEQKERS